MKKDQAYDYIKNGILNQRWSPGVTINLLEVCAQLNMSRTPVQEALTRLAREGFVTIVPQVGAYVRKPSTAEMFERLLMRASLEALMAEWAAARIDEPGLAHLKRLIERMESAAVPLQEYAALNREFHTAIFEASGLGHVKQVAEQYVDYMEYLEAQELLFKNHHRSRSLTEHRMIYHALEERNRTLAKQLMESHIARAIQVLANDAPDAGKRPSSES